MSDLYSNDIDTIRYEDGKLTIQDTGCGCCSERNPITKADAIKEIDKLLAELMAARETIQAIKE